MRKPGMRRVRAGALASTSGALLLLLACDKAPAGTKPAVDSAPNVAAGGDAAQDNPGGEDAPIGDSAGQGSARGSVPAPAEPPMVADALAALPQTEPHALDQAIAAFVAYHGAAKHPEAVLVGDLDLLLGFLGEQTGTLSERVSNDAELNASACRFTGKCDTGEPTPAGEAKLKRILDDGLTIVYAGQGTVEPALDFGALGKRLGPVLPAGAKAYLAAMKQDQQARAHFDSGGYDGDPNALAQAVLAWEAVATSGEEVLTTRARQRADAVLYLYLRLPFVPLHKGAHPVTKTLLESYRAFVADHPGSAYAPVVTEYLAQMKGLGFRPSDAQLTAAIESAKKRVADPAR